MAIFFVYDLINEKKDKDRIQQLVDRLRDEDGNLRHDVDEILESYGEYLLETFQSNEIAALFNRLFYAQTELYRKLIMDQPSYLSNINAEHGFWSQYVIFFLGFCIQSIFPWMDEHELYVPDEIFSILFPFMEKKQTSSFNEMINWLIREHGNNKRQFALTLAPDDEQVDSYVKKVQRWSTRRSVPNFIEVNSILKPIWDKYDDSKFATGLQICLYLSIAISKQQKEFITQEMGLEIKAAVIDQSFGMLSDEMNKKALEQQKQFEIYQEQVFQPVYSLLEDVKKQSSSFAELAQEISAYCDSHEQYIQDFNAQPLISFLQGRMLYMQNKYSEALPFYQDAYDLGRYRIGRKIKVVIYEFMHCCRKIEDIRTFTRLYDWSSYILGQQYKDALQTRVKSVDEVWSDFDHDEKQFVFINHQTGTIYS